MKLNTTTMLAALIVIGLGGFMAGRVSSPTPDSQSSLQDGPTETRSSRASSQSPAGTSASTKSTRPSPSDRPASSSQDRLARLESIVRGENALDRNRALLAYIDQLAPHEFEDAIAHFRSLGLTEGRMGEYALLLTAWAAADPLTALTYARENTRGDFATDTILSSWATIDPEAAVRWANLNFDGEGANPYLAGIIRGIAESNPVRATELLTGMPRSQERGKGLDALMPHLLCQGAEATRAWIANLTDESLKNGAMIRSARELAATDPAGTASWLLANPGEATQRRLDDVYSAWARTDQAAALSSYTSLPAGEERSNALRGVISSVATEDPVAAVSLMDRYPADVNDQVVQQFIWHSFGNDPALAAGQIDRIADQGQRDRMYRRAIGSWIDRDPASAQTWLNANPLPENVQNDLNRRLSGQ